ncbi:haloacid dehalogenase-like hydrolase [Nonomuraea sp. JJY05]|uniref:haloacid dehalogenase-like hydrolase n=1 Tax=Nonomuraea sp. JJY05 TaxID=3350255 RepID=UPI00373FBE0B
MRVAVLDVDGTLVPDTLAGSLPAMLAERGWCPPDRLARLRQAMAGSDPESTAAAMRANELFAASLTDVPCRVVAQVVAELWQARRGRVFPFVRPMVTALRRAGFTVMLISGGPHDMVAHLAAELGIELFCGTRFAEEDGLYTGEVAGTALPAKHEVVADLAGGRGVSWSPSMALGNSLGDATVLRRAGHPIAFEASPGLRLLAAEHGWPLADRHSLPVVLRNRLGLDQPPEPGHEPQPCPAPGPMPSLMPGPVPVRRPGRPPGAASRLGPCSGPGPASVPVPVAGPVAGPAGGPRVSGEAVRRAAQRLSERILAEVSARGAIKGATGSRAIESALLLTLLRREGRLPRRQARLHTYLARCAPAAEPFEAAVINATLHGITIGERERERLIDATFHRAEQHSSARKKLALAAILAAVGPEPFQVHAPSEAFEHRGQTTWTRLRLMAIHLLNTADPVAPELTARLLAATEHGQRHGVIEHMTFSHLFALLALHRVLPGHPVISDGIGHLVAALNPDDGLPFITSEEIFATATAGLALSRAGACPPTITAMADYLAGQQASDGGWPYAEGVRQTDTDSTAHVLAFLHAVDVDRYHQPIEAGRANLCRFIGPGGGVATYHPSHPPEAAMTANTALVLTPYRHAHAAPLHRAISFLLDTQQPDGTFERSWSLSEANAMFRAIHALRAAYQHHPLAHHGRLQPAITAAEGRLLATAHTDGGWGQTPAEPSDPVSTAYTLTALAPAHQHTATIERGLAYLLRHQDADGGYTTSISDQAAPRPLRYSVPILTNNFVLLALTYLHPGLHLSSPHRGGRGPARQDRARR